jgi:universal stress protein A
MAWRMLLTSLRGRGHVHVPAWRVLAAVDFSESSRIALDCAGRLDRQCDAELHLIHVPPVPVGVATYARGTVVAGEIYDDLRSFAASAPAAINRRPRYHVVVGNTARVIRDVAHRERCDVILVGTHGTSGDHVQPFGPTTEDLVREADVSVLVVPRAWKGAAPDAEDLTGVGPVIAGLDFTWPSIDAASAGARLAAALQTRLLAVHAVSTPEPAARLHGDAEAIARQHCAEARQQLEALMAPLRSIAPVDVYVRRGGVATTLAHVTRVEPRAILVLGRAVHARAFGPPGAVTSRVLMQSQVPLMVHSPSS